MEHLVRDGRVDLAQLFCSETGTLLPHELEVCPAGVKAVYALSSSSMIHIL